MTGMPNAPEPASRPAEVPAGSAVVRPGEPPVGRPARWRWFSARRLVIAIVVAWCVAFAASAVVGVRHLRATDREQTTIRQALPTLDAAVGDLAVAVDPGQAIVTVSGYQLVDGACRISEARTGTQYERVLSAYTRAGEEPALLERVAAGLPARYQARLATRSPVPALTADAGNFVFVRGGVVAPGQVRFSADTGCRPGTGPAAEPSSAAAPAGVARAPELAAAQQPLDTLHLTPAGWYVRQVRCPNRDPLWVVEGTTAASGVPDSLADPLRSARLGDAVLVSSPEAYAYRAGRIDVVVRKVDGAVRVSAASGCGRS